ncbi:hypothetical protein [Pseudomonas sp. S2_E02]
MTDFWFRAEYLHDALGFVAAIAEQARIVDLRLKQDSAFPDCEVEITIDLTLAALKRVAKGIEDAHVIEESIAHKKHKKI